MSFYLIMESKGLLIIVLILLLRQSSCRKGPYEFLTTTTQQIVSQDYGSLDDYFSEEFDKNKNCADNEKMAKLEQNYPDNCFSTTKYNQESAFQSCMMQVYKKLNNRCHPLDIKSTGNITYCIQRGTSGCCFSHAECDKTINETFTGADEEKQPYIKYGLDTMADFIATKAKYKVCFKTQERDTGTCEAECKKLKKSEFAKNCSKKVDGHTGVFKCCIQSSNMRCDICNFCCILPVCTRLKDGHKSDEFDTETITKTSIKNKTIPNNTENIEAKFVYQNSSHFCVQKKFENGKDLYFYNMTEYRAANSMDEMKKLEKTVLAYSHLSDFYSPKQRLLFTNETGPKKHAKFLGQEYCFKLYKGTKGKRSKCIKQCKKLKTETFAKECNKKKQSVFKCCISRYNAELFEIFQRKTMKTLNETLKRTCGNDNCWFCCVTAFCSTFQNGKINNTMRTAKTNHDICMKPNNNPITHYLPAYNVTEYMAAYTEDMMCRVSLNMGYVPLHHLRRKFPTKQKINKRCDKIKKKRNKRKLKNRKHMKKGGNIKKKHKKENKKNKKNKKHKKKKKEKKKSEKEKKKSIKHKHKGKRKKTKGKYSVVKNKKRNK